MICAIQECGKRSIARGYCSSHYRRWLDHGDPLGGRIPYREAQRYFNETVLAYDGRECLTWPFTRNDDGYGQIRVSGRTRKVSRLVCEIVHGPAPTSDHEAAHSCGKGHLGCVAKRHLSWKTRQGNADDKAIHGTNTVGERNARAKLTEADVREIRALRGSMAQTAIAAQFGVNRSHIVKIHTRQRWGHI